MPLSTRGLDRRRATDKDEQPEAHAEADRRVRRCVHHRQTTCLRQLSEAGHQYDSIGGREETTAVERVQPLVDAFNLPEEKGERDQVEPEEEAAEQGQETVIGGLVGLAEGAGGGDGFQDHPDDEGSEQVSHQEIEEVTERHGA